MPESEDERAARRRETTRRWRETHAEHLKEYRRRYREENAEAIAESIRAWRVAHPERRRQLTRESARRQAARRRQKAARNARARERYPEIREQAIARGRRFRHEHPEKVREYQRRYKERHPERYRANSAAASQRYRDTQAERIREKQRQAAADRRRENPDYYKEQYARHLEQQRARGRAASRLRSRLKALDLPPRQVHRTYASDKRAHAADADDFFQRRRSVDARARATLEVIDPDLLEVPARVEVRRRQLARKKNPTSVKQRVERATRSGEHHGRAHETAAERQAERLRTRRASDLQRVKMAHDAARQAILDAHPKIYEAHCRRRRATIREEVRMDSIARIQRGQPPYVLDDEVAARLEAESTEILRERIEELRARTLRRVDRVLQKYDPAAPYPTPGSGASSGRQLP